jgi:hypothetical protein
MRRALKPRVWLAALLAVGAFLGGSRAFAQACEGARPTDASGTVGMTYGGAEVTFYDSASGRARVHYALAGTHAPPAASTLEDGVPDAVVVAAEAADTALDKFEALGYRAPLSDADSPCASNGDSDAIDVYLLNFAAADGQAVPVFCEEGLPRRCAGYIVVENDFKRGGYANTAEGLRTVVPHELFHLVQNAYDADVERWWAEGSAQWADKQVYPELQDLERFLPDYFESPWRPLNVPPSGVITNFLYATAIWPVFLGERFDADLVREVFEGLGPETADVLPATDTALQERGSSLAEEFLQFAAYNAATGERAPDSGGYLDAASYPMVELEALGSTEGELVSEVGSGLGAYYYSLNADTPTELSLEADPAREAALLVPLVDGKPQLDAAKPLPATLEGPGIVVVAGQSLSRTDAPFTLRGKAPSAEPDGGDSAPDSSGCAVAGPPRRAGFGGVALGFVVILLGRWRARKRHERPFSCV